MIVHVLIWCGAFIVGTLALLVSCTLIASWMGLLGEAIGVLLPGGRAVFVYTDDYWIDVEEHGETAVFQSGGCSIVVSPTQVSLDGQRLAVLDAAARNVQVTIERGRIEVLADEQDVPTIQMNR